MLELELKNSSNMTIDGLLWTMTVVGQFFDHESFRICTGRYRQSDT